MKTLSLVLYHNELSENTAEKGWLKEGDGDYCVKLRRLTGNW